MFTQCMRLEIGDCLCEHHGRGGGSPQRTDPGRSSSEAVDENGWVELTMPQATRIYFAINGLVVCVACDLSLDDCGR